MSDLLGEYKEDDVACGVQLHLLKTNGLRASIDISSEAADSVSLWLHSQSSFGVYDNGSLRIWLTGWVKKAKDTVEEKYNK